MILLLLKAIKFLLRLQYLRRQVYLNCSSAFKMMAAPFLLMLILILALPTIEGRRLGSFLRLGRIQKFQRENFKELSKSSENMKNLMDGMMQLKDEKLKMMGEVMQLKDEKSALELKMKDEKSALELKMMGEVMQLKDEKSAVELKMKDERADFVQKVSELLDMILDMKRSLSSLSPRAVIGML